MRVVLKIVSGPEAGRKMLVDQHQVLQVGRTAWADVTVASDSQMSNVHFQLRTDAETCYVRDADSCNGTLVNGQAVAESRLRNGDEIQAGNTLFCVEIEGDSPEAGNAKPILADPLRRRSNSLSGSFNATQLASGLTCFGGDTGEIEPVKLAALLKRTTPLVLIADPHRITIPRSLADAPHYIYDWLDPIVRENISPLLIDVTDRGQWPLVVEEGWGSDALICCYTQTPFEKFATALQELGKVTSESVNSVGVADSLIGFAWPKILNAILDSQAVEVLDAWSQVVDFVFLEGNEEETWNLVGQPTLGDTLRDLGLTEVTDEASEEPIEAAP